MLFCCYAVGSNVVYQCFFKISFLGFAEERKCRTILYIYAFCFRILQYYHYYDYFFFLMLHCYRTTSQISLKELFIIFSAIKNFLKAANVKGSLWNHTDQQRTFKECLMGTLVCIVNVRNCLLKLYQKAYSRRNKH